MLALKLYPRKKAWKIEVVGSIACCYLSPVKYVRGHQSAAETYIICDRTVLYFSVSFAGFDLSTSNRQRILLTGTVPITVIDGEYI